MGSQRERRPDECLGSMTGCRCRRKAVEFWTMAQYSLTDGARSKLTIGRCKRHSKPAEGWEGPFTADELVVAEVQNS
jgi:hypothetical protein